jgi:hypothetical protein
MATAIVEVDEFTPTVTVPDPGDDRTAQSVKTGFQAITNRTLYLKNELEAGLAGYSDLPHTWTAPNTFDDVLALGGGNNELAYLPLARERTVILDATAACPRFGGAIVLLGAGAASPFGWQWQTAGNELIWSFRLPHQAILRRVRAAFSGAVGAAVTVHAYQVEANLGDIIAGGTVVHDLGATTVTIADTTQLVTHTIPAPLTNNGALHSYAIDVVVNAVGGVNAWVEVAFADPGPRNF